MSSFTAPLIGAVNPSPNVKRRRDREPRGDTRREVNMRHMYEVLGWTYREIGENFDLSGQRVYRILKERYGPLERGVAKHRWIPAAQRPVGDPPSISMRERRQ